MGTLTYQPNFDIHMPVFNESKTRARTDKKRSIQQSLYSFYNNSALQEHEKIRAEINYLFDFYDADIPEKNKVLKDLRSFNDIGFYSVYFELVIYCLLKKNGFEVKIHPKLNNGSEKKPDFLVTHIETKEEFYLELVTCFEHDDSHLNRLKQGVENLKEAFPNFIFEYDIKGRLKDSRQTDVKIKEIKCWLNSIKLEDISKNNKYIWKIEEFEFELKLTLRTETESLSINSNVIFDHYPQKKIIDSLNTKKDKYGELDKPFIIATTLRPSEFSFNPLLNPMISALCGYLNILKTPHQYEKGFWVYNQNKKIHLKNEHICAVWYFDELIPERISDVNYDLFLLPKNPIMCPSSLYNTFSGTCFINLNIEKITTETYYKKVNIYENIFEKNL